MRGSSSVHDAITLTANCKTHALSNGLAIIANTARDCVCSLVSQARLSLQFLRLLLLHASQKMFIIYTPESAHHISFNQANTRARTHNALLHSSQPLNPHHRILQQHSCRPCLKTQLLRPLVLVGLLATAVATPYLQQPHDSAQCRFQRRVTAAC